PSEFIKKFSKEDYYDLHKDGKLSRHTELLEGYLIEKMTIPPKHSFIVSKLHTILSELLNKDYLIREQKPLSTIDSEPEPDISVVKGVLENFINKHPDSADWVIEVAISSLSLDLSKRKIYANANIPNYWIIDPEKGRILVFSNPEKDEYKIEKIYQKSDFIQIPISPNTKIQLDWI
ncbi:MAG: Uma2 family endonuclease, partial [Leptospiraceae bacterium]|nr:Uma2 family endonuclease [Leptospiraceae bacterium]